MYGVIGSTARKIKKAYGSISATTRSIKKMYGVVGGVTKLIFSTESINYLLKGLFLSYATAASNKIVADLYSRSGSTFSQYLQQTGTSRLTTYQVSDDGRTFVTSPTSNLYGGNSFTPYRWNDSTGQYEAYGSKIIGTDFSQDGYVGSQLNYSFKNNGSFSRDGKYFGFCALVVDTNNGGAEYDNNGYQWGYFKLGILIYKDNGSGYVLDSYSIHHCFGDTTGSSATKGGSLELYIYNESYSTSYGSMFYAAFDYLDNINITYCIYQSQYCYSGCKAYYNSGNYSYEYISNPTSEYKKVATSDGSGTFYPVRFRVNALSSNESGIYGVYNRVTASSSTSESAYFYTLSAGTKTMLSSLDTVYKSSTRNVYGFFVNKTNVLYFTFYNSIVCILVAEDGTCTKLGSFTYTGTGNKYTGYQQETDDGSIGLIFSRSRQTVINSVSKDSNGLITAMSSLLEPTYYYGKFIDPS